MTTQTKQGVIDVRRSMHSSTEVLQVTIPTRPGFCELYYAKPGIGGWELINEEGCKLSGPLYADAVIAIQGFKKRQQDAEARQEFKDLEHEFKHGKRTT